MGNISILRNLINKYLPDKKSFTVCVNGDSMLPIIKNNDEVEVNILPEDQYKIGDILVFPYKDEGLIIHRLLKKRNGKCFCKGDNSLRLEDIDIHNIIGVVKVDHDNHCTNEFVESSLLISQIYRKCKYDAQLTRMQKEYCEYADKYLRMDR